MVKLIGNLIRLDENRSVWAAKWPLDEETGDSYAFAFRNNDKEIKIRLSGEAVSAMLRLIEVLEGRDDPAHKMVIEFTANSLKEELHWSPVDQGL